MVTVDKAHTAKLKIGGQHFEILIDSNKAVEFKVGKSVSLRDVLAVEKIFSDSKKGLEVSLNALKQCFGTDDVMKVAEQIILKGDFAVTAEYKQKQRDEKKKQIIYTIHRNAVDPTTHAPHPVTRIEMAMNEAKVHIDENEDTMKQMQEILKKLRPILPIKFEIKEIAVKIPPEYAAKSYPVLNNFGKRLKEEWLNDGSLSVVIEIPGGLEQDFYEKLNHLCHGNVWAQVVQTK
jgi:ribosome maturation protein SDO1